MRPTFFAFFSKNYFDSFFSEIRKLPKEQRLFVPSTFHMCKLLLVNPGKKNKNLEAFQNDPSEIQCVANFAYTKDIIDKQIEFKGHCKYFLQKK